MKSEKSKIGIVGAGFSGLSAACYLTNAGYSVDVFEKNEAHGGRAIYLTWVPVGIGCRMYLSGSLMTLDTK